MTQPEQSSSPLPTPKITASTAPMDIHEWRARWESRCNALALVGVVLLLQTGLARTPWIAMVALIGGPLFIVASFALRPRLPWRAPEALTGSATGTDHEGRSTTGPFPVPGLLRAPMPAPVAPYQPPPRQTTGVRG